MTFQNLISGIKLFALTGCLVFTTTAFSQKASTNDQPDYSRAKLQYKQTHGLDTLNGDKLFADGFKLKMDMSVLEEAINERDFIDVDAIPSEDLYGGVWTNQHVNAYESKVNGPAEFEVDLSNFTMPAVGHVTSNFGRRGSRRYHYGVDIKAQTGDTIYAAFDGKIRVKQYDRRGYGYYVVIRHINGLETVYGHLSKFLVTENDFVMSGDPIGLAGNTGRSFGSHLHLETRFLGKPIDPNFIIDFENQVCHRDKYLVSNDSYKKTTLSSRVIQRKEPVNYTRTTTSTNKFVSGDVTHYKVKSGDTLDAIARKHGVTISQLCDLNNMTARTTLRVGRTLLVNSTARSTTNSTVSSTTTSKTTTTTTSSEDDVANEEVKHYKVKRGDTLGNIAYRNGLSLKQLCTLNNISANSTLSIGKTLRVS